jgi:hypothetical protein
MLRVSRVFGQLKLVGEIMGIGATVVDDVWAVWSDEVVDAFDDDLQIGRDLLRFIEARMGSSIIELWSDDDEDVPTFGDDDEGGEKGNSYQKRDGWYDDDFVYLRLDPLALIMQGHGKAAFYEWLRSKGIIAPTVRDRWTVYVPKLMPRRTALRIDLARLQDVVGD